MSEIIFLGFPHMRRYTNISGHLPYNSSTVEMGLDVASDLYKLLFQLFIAECHF